MKKKNHPYLWTMLCNVCDTSVELSVMSEDERPLPLCPMCGESEDWDESDVMDI